MIAKIKCQYFLIHRNNNSVIFRWICCFCFKYTCTFHLRFVIIYKITYPTRFCALNTNLKSVFLSLKKFVWLSGTRLIVTMQDRPSVVHTNLAPSFLSRIFLCQKMRPTEIYLWYKKKFRTSCSTREKSKIPIYWKRPFLEF